jgi:hypothetical protein
LDTTKVAANAGIPSLVPRCIDAAAMHVADLFGDEADDAAPHAACEPTLAIMPLPTRTTPENVRTICASARRSRRGSMRWTGGIGQSEAVRCGDARWTVNREMAAMLCRDAASQNVGPITRGLLHDVEPASHAVTR